MQDVEKGNVLIVDDDEGVVKIIRKTLSRIGFEVAYSLNLSDGFAKLGEQDFDLVLLDVNLPDGDGIEHISRIKEKELAPQVIIMTAYTNADGAQIAIESGAWDYLQKPIAIKDLELQVLRAIQYQEQKKQIVQSLHFDSPHIIGQSKAINACKKMAARIVRSDANVLITGETGTGKELFARAIHENSDRRNADFIVVDCSVLTENLIESVLFGHEKGSFTGADKTRKGLISLANGGTLFLDEVGELPESIQSSFLRVLQEKKFRPVGSETELDSDFRVICATNKNLDTMAAENRFRTDLLYRLKTFVLELPPLRRRTNDIRQLAEAYIQKSCRQHHIPDKQCSPDFLEILEQYDWPGNVRELINVVETSIAAAHFEQTLFAIHLPSAIRAQIRRSSFGSVPSRPAPSAQPGISSSPDMTHKQHMEKMEKEYLQSLYAMANGNIQDLMDQSGLSRTVLYRKLNKHNIR